MRLAALILLVALALAGCSNEPVGEPAPTAAASTTTAATSTAALATPDDRYLAQLDQWLTTSSVSDERLLGIGRFICENSMVSTRESTVQAVADANAGGDTTVGEFFVAAALDELCPTASFATTPPIPAGPRTSFDEGTYEVGVDIQPGRYRSPGGDNCYWARLDADQEILDNDLSSGPSVFTVQESDAFIELNRCTWTLSE